MKKIIKILYVYLLISIPITSNAQESDLGNWLIYLGNVQINEKYNWHHEVQYRNYNFAGDLEQLLLRTGIGMNLTEKNNNLLIGYGYILSKNYDGTISDKIEISEHRIFQQFTTKQNFGIVYLQHRYRLEERFIESNFRMRFRYFLSLQIPINHTKMIDNTLYASMYNEIFVNSSNNYYDRNRVYIGLGYRLSKSIRTEFGYLNQIFQNGNRDQLNFIAFLTL